MCAETLQVAKLLQCTRSLPCARIKTLETILVILHILYLGDPRFHFIQHMYVSSSSLPASSSLQTPPPPPLNFSTRFVSLPRRYYLLAKMSFSAFVSTTPLSLTKPLSQSITTHRPSTILNPPPHTRASIRMAISPEAARSAIALYGVTVAGGGVFAYLRSGSRPSIISGVIAGIVLAAAYYKNSVPLALVTAALLTIVFALRYSKSKKFFPPAVLCLVSLAAAVYFGMNLYA